MPPELHNLKESNEFLNLLLDNINSAVLIADENLQIHYTVRHQSRFSSRG